MQKHPLIKICGIKDSQTLDYAISAGADMLGFVHFAKSPRHLEIADIAVYVRQCIGRVQSAVLLVNPEQNLIDAVVAIGPDIVQLHGQESLDIVRSMVLDKNQPVMKALPVGEAADLAFVPDYFGAGATILLDAKPPKNATRPGGLGNVFDWHILKSLDPEIDFVLSGGLAPHNIAQAIKQVRPMGVDTSSGVESSPGIKDRTKIKQFIANAATALAS